MCSVFLSSWPNISLNGGLSDPPSSYSRTASISGTVPGCRVMIVDSILLFICRFLPTPYFASIVSPLLGLRCGSGGCGIILRKYEFLTFLGLNNLSILLRIFNSSRISGSYWSSVSGLAKLFCNTVLIAARFLEANLFLPFDLLGLAGAGTDPAKLFKSAARP